MEQQSAQAPAMGRQLPGVSELLKQAKDMMMKRKELFFALAAIPAVVQLVGVLLAETGQSAFFALFGILTLVSIILSFLATIAMVKAYADESMHDWKAAFKSATPLFWPLLWVSILVGIVVMIGTLLFILPGIYLGVAFSFYSYHLILEGKRGWNAAQASRELVRGYWWAVFGRYLALVLVIVVLSGILTALAAVLGSPIVDALVSFVITVVTTPYAVAFYYLIYKALKGMKPAASKAQPAAQPQA